MNAAFAAVEWADLAATIVLAGGLITTALLAPLSARGRRLQWRAAAALAVVLPAEFALTALRMEMVSGMRGTALVAGRRLPGGVVAVAAAGWLLLRSFQGHAGAHGTLPAVIDWTHLLAAAAWLGGLVQLVMLPRPVPADVAGRMRMQATASVAVLVPAGLYAAFLHVPHLDALTGTPYGETLLAKLALASVLAILGAANHFGHVPAMRRGEPQAEPRFVRAVRVEVVVGAVVLGLTALLGVLPMPHGLVR